MAALRADLVEAVQKGLVSVEATAEESYAKTRLRVHNKARDPLSVDFSRSGLTPKKGNSQRIGLAYPVGFNAGDYEIAFEPGQESDLVFESRCLDRHRPAPGDGAGYSLIPGLLPPFIVEALRRGLDQRSVWDEISRHGEQWGVDERPAPSLSHEALAGEWEAEIPDNRYRLRITWNPDEGRYEGRPTGLGVLSAEVGFSVGELTYLATPTGDPRILSEQGMWRSGSGGVSTGEYWRSSTVDLSQWPSFSEGVFYGGNRHIRIR